MSEQPSVWGTPTEVEAPKPATNEVSPFHEETLAEVLPELPKEKRISFGKRILEKLAGKPKSAVGDLSETPDVAGKLVNYRSEGFNNLSDGGLEKTGQYDHSREGMLTALREEADIEDAQRSIDPFSPNAPAERAALQVKQHEAERETVAAAQNAEMRRNA